MLLFTIHDIRVLIQVLAHEIQDVGGVPSYADLLNPESDLWSRTLHRLVDEVHHHEIALVASERDLHQRSGLVDAKPANPMNMGVSEAAHYLRVSPNTIYKWTSQGRIPYRKVGTKKLSFCRDELDRFIASRRVADDKELQERASKIAGKMQMKRVRLRA